MPHAALAILSLALAVQDPPAPDNIQKERASLLRSALKPHAAFQGVDRDGRIVLQVEGETGEKAWPIDPDAEIRIRGYWGGLEDLAQGERIWLWTRVDRDGKPRAVFMIADEMSEQDIHQVPYTLAAVDGEQKTVVLRRKLDGKTEQTRSLKISPSMVLSKEGDQYVFRSASPDLVVKVAVEGTVFVQSAGETLLRLADAEALSKLKEAQKARMEERWRKQGLPGTVTGIHLLSGEIDLAMDHEGMRWARSLKPGDRVTLQLEKPVKAAVAEVRSWYERTRLSLVSNGCSSWRKKRILAARSVSPVTSPKA